jgi:hypothetical protein
MSHPNDKLDLNALRQGIDYKFPVSLRGTKYTLRPLSINEEDRITREVLREMHEIPQHERSSMSESIRMIVKKLEAASTSDVGKSDYTLPVGTTERWTPKEIDYVFKEWMTECDKANPRPEKLTGEQIHDAVSVLKKSTAKAETIMIELSFFQLVDICQHLIQPELQTDKSPG